MSTTQDMLDERYGRRRSPVARWIGGIAIALVGVAAVAFLWQTVATSAQSVSADTTSFVVVDEHTVEVNVQISAPAGAAVACALEAQDVEHGVVGWRVVEFPASDAHVQAFQEEIPTVAAATTGFVNSCWVT